MLTAKFKLCCFTNNVQIDQDSSIEVFIGKENDLVVKGNKLSLKLWMPFNIDQERVDAVLTNDFLIVYLQVVR